MNDGKKRRSSAELPAHKRFEKSRSRWIYPSFQNTVFVFCGDWGSAPTSMKQAGPVWTESACFRKVGTALHCLPISLYIIIAIRDNQKTKTIWSIFKPNGVARPDWYVVIYFLRNPVSQILKSVS